MPAFQPQAFGKYFLVDKIAMGGMAEIFLARPQSRDDAGSYLVIKRILPHFTGNAQFIDMFIDEAKISSLLSHVNIVPLYDLGKINDSYFLAMEYVPGQDLKGVVKRCSDRGVRLSYEHAAYVMREVALGLDYAHGKVDPKGRPLQIVHRDISPQNILVGYDGQVKITDFGIAKASSKLDSTQVGTLKGKFGYMAPEQVVAGMELDHRADIFAAGIILWELITGQRLFSGRNEIEILERVRAARIDPPSMLDSEVPRELERIIFRSLMKDREKRYQAGKEMANDLTRFLAQISPRFSATDMSSVMRELFAPEIESIKTKWNVVIGAVVDRGHAELGASLESTRPDQRVEDDIQPAKAEPDMVIDLPDDDVEQTDEAARTMIAQKPSPQPEKTRMTTPAPVALNPKPKAKESDRERTSAVDLLAELDAEVAAQKKADDRGRGADKALADELFPDDATQKKPPVETNPLPRTRARRKGPSLGVRLFSWGAFLAAAGAAAVGVLMYTGRIANPWAAPVVEVFSGVDAMISIDGNIVLASGRQGRWPVGEGTRTVEVRAKGYEPLVTTVNAVGGQVAIVDAVLVPLADATAEVEIRSVPPGAKAALDEEPVGTTPLKVSKKLGEHSLRLSRPGYDDAVVPLRLVRPGAGDPVDVVLVPNIASLAVTTTPPGARLFVGGKPVGVTPVVVPKLEPGVEQVLQLVLRGYRNETRRVSPPGGDTPFAVDVVLEPLDAAKAPFTATSPTPAPQPIGTPAPSAKSITPGMGLLSVEIAGGWAEVFVDGVKIAARTPLEKFEIAPGEHTLRVFNPVEAKERTVQVQITQGQETRRRLSLQ